MSSRDHILRAVRRNRPPAVPLPQPEAAQAEPSRVDLAARFAEASRAAGAEVVEGREDDLPAILARRHPDARRLVTAAPGLGGLPLLDADASPRGVADLDVLVCRGALGVAENGAVWLPESAMGTRAAPFLAQHLVLVVDRGTLVVDLHAASGSTPRASASSSPARARRPTSSRPSSSAPTARAASPCC